jgi:hypothetical protein
MNKRVMNKYTIILAIGVFVSLVVSCEQYAIFGAIADEVKPKPALIKGTPSKIVKDASGNLYVANGELWQFSSGSWTKASAPDNTRDVATVVSGTGAGVYVIAVGDLPSLSKLDGGSIGVPGTVQGIHGAGSTLYIAVGNGDSYSVYAYGGSGNPTPVSKVSGLLKGAAYYPGNYYLATSDGLFHSTSGSSSFAPVKHNGENISGSVLGVVVLFSNSAVAAVTENAGYLVIGGTVAAEVSGDSFTGALAVSDDTLYVGRTRGYREVDDPSSLEFKAPSIASYTSTIALVRVTSLYAVSNDLIFASVFSSEPKRSGLMSLRGGSWNMEE